MHAKLLARFALAVALISISGAAFAHHGRSLPRALGGLAADPSALQHFELRARIHVASSGRSPIELGIPLQRGIFQPRFLTRSAFDERSKGGC